MPYDPFKDFDPISLAVSTTQVLTVTPSLPFAPSRAARSREGQSRPIQLLLARAWNARAILSASFSACPSVSTSCMSLPGRRPGGRRDHRGPHADVLRLAGPTVGQIKDGKLRALAVATRKAALGAAGRAHHGGSRLSPHRGQSWVGLLVPAGTPKDIVASLNRRDHAEYRAAGDQGSASRRSASSRSQLRRRTWPGRSGSKAKSGQGDPGGQHQGGVIGWTGQCGNVRSTKASR